MNVYCRLIYIEIKFQYFDVLSGCIFTFAQLASTPQLCHGYVWPLTSSSEPCWTAGVAILMIVILNALIAAVTENDANNALDALSKMSP